MKTKEAKAKLLHAFLVDPYQREVIRCGVGKSLDDWRKILRCDYVEHILLARGNDGKSLDMWVDEEFLLRHKLAPSFRFKTAYSGGEFTAVHGYALILAGDSEGESRSLFLTAPEFLEMFTRKMELQFERYEESPECERGELGAIPYIDERMRNIELEAPDSFKYEPELGDVESFDE